MDQLTAIEQQMQDDNKNKHTGNGVYATIAWLKEHQAGNYTPKDSASIFKHYEAVGAPPTIPKDLHQVLGESEVNEKLIGGWKPPVKPTLQDIEAQLKELQIIDKKMEEAELMKHTGNDVLDTIKWLKDHHTEEVASTSPFTFLETTIQHIHEGGAGTDDLPVGWGLGCLAPYTLCWSQIGFSILNQPFQVDMMNIRRMVLTGELKLASPKSIARLTKWIQGFNAQLHMAIRAKQSLLEERCAIAGVEFKVTTIYDRYHTLLATTLASSKEDRITFGYRILELCNELEAIFRDELNAVSDILKECFAAEKEYKAISNFIRSIEANDPNGILYAKIFGWICNSMSIPERQQFLVLFDKDVQACLGGKWMKKYAHFIRLLAPFHVDYSSATTYSRSQAIKVDK